LRLFCFFCPIFLFTACSVTHWGPGLASLISVRWVQQNWHHKARIGPETWRISVMKNVKVKLIKKHRTMKTISWLKWCHVGALGGKHLRCLRFAFLSVSFQFPLIALKALTLCIPWHPCGVTRWILQGTSPQAPLTGTAWSMMSQCLRRALGLASAHLRHGCVFFASLWWSDPTKDVNGSILHPCVYPCHSLKLIVISVI
jgi:hypothetical protein